MTRAALAALLLTGCIDFAKDLEEFCTSTGRCGPDSGSGGAQGGGSGGSSGGAQGGGFGGGATDAGCLPFGASCGIEGQCCATTTVSAAAVPLACSRLNYCQLTGADCRETGFTCGTPEQCCSNRCAQGRCEACSIDGEPCTSARNCCSGTQCGDDGLCHDARVGDAPDGGRCTSSSVCARGWCDLPDASVPEGTCKDPMGACTGLRSMPGAACCGGLASPAGTCCLGFGAWCQSSLDCCSGECWGGRCLTEQPKIGQRCESSGNCQGANSYCDPAARLCTDRWCFGAAATPYRGCCTISGTVCRFADAGTCVMPNFPSATAEACCSGLRTGTNNCTGIQIFDP